MVENGSHFLNATCPNEVAATLLELVSKYP
jgi:hypothetical protein